MIKDERIGILIHPEQMDILVTIPAANALDVIYMMFLYRNGTPAEELREQFPDAVTQDTFERFRPQVDKDIERWERRRKGRKAH